jgi:glycosyltransferase involved in cell wall biosynthesis
MNGGPRILDIVNTDHAALNFLVHRTNFINQRSEFQNDIVCSRGPHLDRLDVRGAQVTPIDIPRGLSPAALTRMLVSLVRHLRANSYSIVHTHNSITGAVGRIAARLARVPATIHTIHGFHFHERMIAPQRLPYVAAERWLSRWCDVLLSQNREELVDIRRLGFRPRMGVFYIGNGIDLRRFPPRTAPPDNPRPVVLCVGRLEPVKNHDMLFDALQRLHPRRRPLVWLVGEGPCRARYAARLLADGLSECVQFLGYRYDIPDLTAAADIAVLTSLKEGMPRALMEAMAVGVPVIATNVKGSREVVQNGRTGFLVPLGDAGALADCLALLIDSPARRQEMGGRGVEHARRQFDEDRVADRLVAIYRSTLAARGVTSAALPAWPAAQRAGAGGA